MTERRQRVVIVGRGGVCGFTRLVWRDVIWNRGSRLVAHDGGRAVS